MECNVIANLRAVVFPIRNWCIDVQDDVMSDSMSLSLGEVLIGLAINFFLFHMSGVTRFDRTLRFHVVDEQEWKKLSIVCLQFRFEKD
jgi:hypothetical protein